MAAASSGKELTNMAELTGTNIKKPRTKPLKLEIKIGLDGGKIFCCPICCTTYTDTERLEKHLLIHQIKRFICKECGCTVQEKSALKRHHTTHTSVRPYICTICKIGFHRYDYYLVHLRLCSNKSEKSSVRIEVQKDAFKEGDKNNINTENNVTVIKTQAKHIVLEVVTPRVEKGEGETSTTINSYQRQIETDTEQSSCFEETSNNDIQKHIIALEVATPRVEKEEGETSITSNNYQREIKNDVEQSACFEETSNNDIQKQTVVLEVATPRVEKEDGEISITSNNYQREIKNDVEQSACFEETLSNDIQKQTVVLEVATPRVEKEDGEISIQEQSACLEETSINDIQKQIENGVEQIVQEPDSEEIKNLKFKVMSKNSKLVTLLECPKCLLSYSDKKDLETHLLKHTMKRYVCDICEDTFAHAMNLDLHMRMHNPKNIDEPHTAVDAISLVGDTLNINKSQVSVEEIVSQGVSKLNTKQIEVKKQTHPTKVTKFVETTNFEQSSETDKFQKQIQNSTNFKYIKITNKPDRSIVLDCPMCSIKCLKKRELEKHLLKHKIKRYICDICGHVFSDIQSRNTHVRGHFPNLSCCDICKKTFKRIYELRRHLRTIHKEELNKVIKSCCNICKKTYNRPDLLKRHLRTYHKQEYKKMINEKHKGAELISQTNISLEQSTLKLGEPYVLIEKNILTLLPESDTIQMKIQKRKDPKTESKSIETDNRTLSTNMCFGETSNTDKFQKQIQNNVEQSNAKLGTEQSEPYVLIEKNLLALVPESDPIQMEIQTPKDPETDNRTLATNICFGETSNTNKFQNQFQNNVEQSNGELGTTEQSKVQKTKYVTTFSKYIKITNGPDGSIVLDCPICPMKCSEREELENHLLKHKIKRYICHICGHTFSRTRSRNTHMRRHFPNVSCCGICKKTFTRIYDLRQHLRRVHREEENKVIKSCCNICKKTYNRPDLLKRHLRTYHKREYKMINKEHKGAELISQTNISLEQNTLKLHEPYVLIEKNVLTLVPSDTIQMEIQKQKDPKTESKSIETDSRIFTTNMCFGETSNTDKFQNNVEQSNAKLATEQSEPYVLIEKNLLALVPESDTIQMEIQTRKDPKTESKSIETDNRTLATNICFGETSNTNKIRKQFQNNVEQSNAELATEQSKVLKTKYVTTFSKYIKITNGPDGSIVLDCPICPMKYSGREELENHLLKHKIKRYICHTCGHTFSHTQSRNKHMRRHFSNVSCCGICKKTFKRIYDLRRHLRRVHKEEENKIINSCCNICKKTYKRADLLKRHLRTYHKREYKMINKEHKGAELISQTNFSLEQNSLKLGEPYALIEKNVLTLVPESDTIQTEIQKRKDPKTESKSIETDSRTLATNMCFGETSNTDKFQKQFQNNVEQSNAKLATEQSEPYVLIEKNLLALVPESDTIQIEIQTRKDPKTESKSIETDNRTLATNICSGETSNTNKIQKQFQNNVEQSNAELATEQSKVLKTKYVTTFSKYVKITNGPDGSIVLDCPICPMKCSEREELENHLLKHKIKRYICHTCGHTFSHTQSRNKHMRRHFSNVSCCGICKKTFKRIYDLRRHLRRVHKGEENEITNSFCNICKKTFKRADLLKRHLRTYHKQEDNIISNKEHKGDDFISQTNIILEKDTSNVDECQELIEENVSQLVSDSDTTQMDIQKRKQPNKESKSVETNVKENVPQLVSDSDTAQMHILKRKQPNKESKSVETNIKENISQLVSDSDTTQMDIQRRKQPNKESKSVETKNQLHASNIRFRESSNTDKSDTLQMEVQNPENLTKKIKSGQSSDFEKQTIESSTKQIKIVKAQYLLKNSKHVCTILECPKCPVSYSDKEDLEKHLLNHNIVRYICDVCGDTFANSTSRNRHMSWHNTKSAWTGSQTQNDNNKIFVDKRTAVSATTVENTLNIDEVPVKEILSQGAPEPNTYQVRITNKPDGSIILACPKCPIKYLDKTDLEKHLLKHKIKRYICNMCGDVFSDTQSCNTHMTGHGTNLSGCSMCQKSFRRADHLKQHFRTVHKPKINKYKRVTTARTRSQKQNKYKRVTTVWTRSQKQKGRNKIINEEHECADSLSQVNIILEEGTVNIDKSQVLVERNVLQGVPELDTIEGKIQKQKHLTHESKSAETDNKLYATNICFEETLNTNKQKQIQRHTEQSVTGTKYSKFIKYIKITNKSDGRTILGCPICPSSYLQKKELERHLQKHNIKRYICEICGLTFSQRHSRNTHMRRHSPIPTIVWTESQKHNDNSKNIAVNAMTDDNDFLIGESQILQSESNTAKLKIRKPKVVGKYIGSVKIKTTNNISNVLNKTKKSETIDFLQIKITKALNGSSIFHCPACHVKYSEKEEFQVHLVTHQIKSFFCDICGFTFRTKVLCKEHKLIHSSSRPFACELCQTSFARKDELFGHLKRNSCSKRSRKQADLIKVKASEEDGMNDNIDTDITLINYVNVNLSQHSQSVVDDSITTLTNTKKPKYVLIKITDKSDGSTLLGCPKCSVSFKNTEELKKHISKHKIQRYVCKICGHTFPNRRSCERHIIIHNVKRSRFCYICKKGLKQSENLKQHIRRVHAKIIKKRRLTSAQQRSHKQDKLFKQTKKNSCLKHQTGMIQDLIKNKASEDDCRNAIIDTDICMLDSAEESIVESDEDCQSQLGVNMEDETLIQNSQLPAEVDDMTETEEESIVDSEEESMVETEEDCQPLTSNLDEILIRNSQLPVDEEEFITENEAESVVESEVESIVESDEDCQSHLVPNVKELRTRLACNVNQTLSENSHLDEISKKKSQLPVEIEEFITESEEEYIADNEEESIVESEEDCQSQLVVNFDVPKTRLISNIDETLSQNRLRKEVEEFLTEGKEEFIVETEEESIVETEDESIVESEEECIVDSEEDCQSKLVVNLDESRTRLTSNIHESLFQNNQLPREMEELLTEGEEESIVETEGESVVQSEEEFMIESEEDSLESEEEFSSDSEEDSQDARKQNVALSPQKTNTCHLSDPTFNFGNHGKSTGFLPGLQLIEFNKKFKLNATVTLDKLCYNQKGVVTWPPVAEGQKVDMEAALGNLKDWEQRGQKRKRSFCPPKGQEVYRQKYVVEKIEKMEFDPFERMHMFYIKWEGYHHECNTWEPLDHLDGAEEVVSRFLEERYNEATLKEVADKVGVQINTVTDEMLFSALPGPSGKKDLSQAPSKFTAQRRLLKFLDRNIHPTYVRMVEDCKRTLLTYLLVMKREKQSVRLKKWENIINKMDKSEAHISVENNVDLEPPPENFCYINGYVPTGNIVIPNTPDTYCLCTDCGPGIKSCCGKQEHNAFSYTKTLRMNVNPGNAIYECNKLCKCGPSCRNRVVQHGRKVPLCIFRTDNGRGWGVKVLRKIACGEFVCEYVGEVIDHEEAERRGKAYDAEGRTYLFDLDYNSRDNLYTVDAAKYGNVSHFINHSCDPNLGVYATWINCQDPNLPRLALFALREVQKGEELTFDYMMNIDEPIIKPKTPEKTGGRQKLDTPEKGALNQSDRPTCKCSADTCRSLLDPEMLLTKLRHAYIAYKYMKTPYIEKTI